MRTTTPDPARGIALAAGGAFAAFYIFYAAAPVAFAHASPGAGMRVAVVMLVVVAVQPLVLVSGRWTGERRRAVLAAVTAMALGSAVMPFAGHWPGQALLAVGFGVFVVTSTAWVKEAVPPDGLGRALGVYGFGSAIGGALGAPIGLYVAERLGVTGVAAAGAVAAIAALLPTIRVGPAAPSVHRELGVERSAVAAVPAERQLERPRVGYAAASGGLVGHLLAVTIYATVLSGLTHLQQERGTWLVVASAFVIQTFLATGRLLGGAAVDRWSPGRTGLLAFILLLVGATGFIMSALPVVMLGAGVLVGVASGACQTAALTSLMRRTRDTAGTDRASAAWNVCFDIGLGLGALAAGQAPHDPAAQRSSLLTHA